MNAIKPLIFTTALVALPLALAADEATVTIPATNQIVTTDGNWHRAAAEAQVDGLATGNGTLVLLPRDVSPGDTDPLALTAATLLAGSGLRGSITFPGQIPQPGESGVVSIAFPADGSNVRDLLVSIETSEGTRENRVTLTGDMANTWVPVGGFSSSAEGDLTIRLVADQRTNSPDPFSPAYFAVSALRVSPGTFDTGSPLIEAAAPSPGMDDPFSVPVTDDLEDPFAVMEEVDDPFAVPPVAETDDPFAVPPVTETDDPFAVAPVEGVDDPFAVMDEIEDPFAAPDPTTDDPFAAVDVDDPFAAPDATEDPFAVVADPEDPFAVPEGPFVADPVIEVTPTPTPAPTPVPTPRFTPVATPEPVELIELQTHDTLDAAKTAARSSGKRILVIFTGEGRRASEFDEALRHPDMRNLLGDFEIVMIDYRRNRDLARRYSVNQFPYIVVLSSLGFTEDHIMGHGDTPFLRERIAPHGQSIFR